ncbi:MAG: hypothetical protein HY704_16205 [Gemmatimonadetes bacterium]|nr:hypothetical protein [Gemmatimonadota bacterium]
MLSVSEPTGKRLLRDAYETLPGGRHPAHIGPGTVIFGGLCYLLWGAVNCKLAPGRGVTLALRCGRCGMTGRRGTALAPPAGSALLVLALAMVGHGCARVSRTEAEAGIIPADRFIAAYVDLRLAALKSPGGEVEAAERKRVLARHGIESDDLLRFVERHGRDAEFMSAVWDTIEQRVEGHRLPTDSVQEPRHSPVGWRGGGSRHIDTSRPLPRASTERVIMG